MRCEIGSGVCLGVAGMVRSQPTERASDSFRVCGTSTGEGGLPACLPAYFPASGCEWMCVAFDVVGLGACLSLGVTGGLGRSKSTRAAPACIHVPIDVLWEFSLCVVGECVHPSLCVGVSASLSPLPASPTKDVTCCGSKASASLTVLSRRCMPHPCHMSPGTVRNAASRNAPLLKPSQALLAIPLPPSLGIPSMS